MQMRESSMTRDAAAGARERELLRRRLSDRAQVLLDEISSGMHSDALELDPREPGTGADRATVVVASAERDARELRDIEAALERMRDGTYGSCADCGVTLAWARLDAKPEAPRCITCEEAHERRAGLSPTF
jgi:RNA polymerase-binding transcription factor DksA